MSTFHIHFITPLFSRGAYDDRPEVRAPSIRGQLHWWFRALGGSYNDEKAVFGGVHGEAVASKVVIRVCAVQGQTGPIPTLPHKSGGQASPKHAYKAGTSFDLNVLERLGGIRSPQQRQFFARALEGWLLLGTLGLRSTRAGGSFLWSPLKDTNLTYPVSFDTYEKRCRALLDGVRLRFALLDTVYDDAEKARCHVSDTLGGRDDRQGEDDLARFHYPLGRIFSGRKTSPLRFRLVAMDNRFRIAAIWDARDEITGNRTTADLEGIVALLAKRKPALGRQLAESNLVTNDA